MQGSASVRTLSSNEVASRLSFLATLALPDKALLDTATAEN
jgi:hypothetical protein